MSTRVVMEPVRNSKGEVKDARPYYRRSGMKASAARAGFREPVELP